MNQKKIAKSLGILTGIKQNIPKTGSVEGKYVNEYNNTVSTLEEATSEQLSDFKIDQNELQPRITAVGYGDRKAEYSSERYCDASYLMMKIDSLLGYFTYLLEPQDIKEGIGFKYHKK